jgi:hypothetical protein
MNNYVILINGILAPPGIVEIRKANSSVDGQFVHATMDKNQMGEKKLKYLDVFEVRASNVVRRYHADKFTDDDDKIKCRCFGVDNTF